MMWPVPNVEAAPGKTLYHGPGFRSWIQAMEGLRSQIAFLFLIKIFEFGQGSLEKSFREVQDEDLKVF
jgi:hypothetical protein